ncbi:MAG TPA: cysteine desulfurase [Candidatus Thermoplasmatota archaeon]|nr:cysteine desulfurase [Candidatus Thermoplasmatota archaeon]
MRERTVEDVRADFPILDRPVHGKRLVYLDNAATTQRPRQVIEAMTRFYEETNANVHRSIHHLGERATELYIGAHTKAGAFVGGAAEECVFTKNATEALNLVAYAWARRHLESGDDVLVTRMEHHSNFVPWQAIAKEKGARLRIAELTKEGDVDVEDFKAKCTARTKVASFTGMSNVLGTLPPVRELAEVARDRGAVSVCDGAQLVPHRKVDVARLGVDFLAFSGHKMLGPTGIGVLWGRREILELMEPFLYGGEMIRRVRDDATTWNELPWKFEAGTPNIAEGVGLAAAIDYLEGLGMDWVERHERDLVEYGHRRLLDVPGLQILGPPASRRGGVLAFTLGDVHAHDLASLMDDGGVAIRAGHHCAQPLMDHLGLASAARASFYVYNTRAEVDALVEALTRARGVFGA